MGLNLADFDLVIRPVFWTSRSPKSVPKKLGILVRARTTYLALHYLALTYSKINFQYQKGLSHIGIITIIILKQAIVSPGRQQTGKKL